MFILLDENERPVICSYQASTLKEWLLENYGPENVTCFMKEFSGYNVWVEEYSAHVNFWIKEIPFRK